MNKRLKIPLTPCTSTPCWLAVPYQYPTRSNTTPTRDMPASLPAVHGRRKPSTISKPTLHIQPPTRTVPYQKIYDLPGSRRRSCGGLHRYFENDQSLYLLYRSHKSSPHSLKTQRSNMFTQQLTPHTAFTNTHSLWYKTHKGNRDGKFCASFVVHSNCSSSWNRTHAHVHLPSGRGSARCRRQRWLTGEAEGPRQRSLRDGMRA